MSILQLKQSLHDEIESIDNDAYLNLLKIFIETHIKNKDIVIPEDVRRGIEESRKEMKDGKFYSNEEVDTMIQEWLKE